ncbi:hypothetical protein JJQ73_00340 [Corynebacterium glutamicum]|uniref:hypothetical protein n=1 Tax=Corynebacterium glutamicum TaxID=1718 RepID=UPI001C6DF9B7|nr:hypothetical protein [Corynebacterium glutamicum]QYR17590.1 hypothetical protein JJQ73_00340 [Corynebacterium glutamicum]
MGCRLHPCPTRPHPSAAARQRLGPRSGHRRWAISVPLAEEWIAARLEEQRARPNRFTLDR